MHSMHYAHIYVHTCVHYTIHNIFTNILKTLKKLEIFSIRNMRPLSIREAPRPGGTGGPSTGSA